MSREQERDPFRRLRAELQDSQRHHYGLNTKRVSSPSYQDTVQRSARGNLDISSHRSIRDAANMPIFLDDSHKSNILSRDFNTGYDSNIQPSNIRSHTTPVSAALEALQTYGPVTQSPSRSSMQKDWNVAFSKNINNPPENLQALLSSMLKSKDSNIQTYSAESSAMSTSDVSGPPFNDLNLNNVDEEDEYLYGDSNSLPEMPQLLKDDSDQNNVKTDRPMWSDDEDLFGESSVTSQNRSNLDQMKNSTLWTSRNKNIQLKLSQKPEGNTKDSSRNIPETYSVEQQHSSVSSAEYQNVRNLLNKFPGKDIKSILSEKDSRVTSASSIKSKYHVAAQVLKKKMAEKSNIFDSETIDFPSSYPADMKNNSASFKNDIQENKLMTKSNIPIKDSKELKVRKSVENVKRLPKAFLQKDLDNIADYIKPQRKRMHSREEVEYVKHPRHENYRNISPNRDQPPHQSSRHRSPVDGHRHQSPYHSRHRSPDSDLRYKLSHHFKSKSPHRDYDRHSYEYNSRHNESRWHHSRSPSRKSGEQSSRHYSYRARSPGSFRSRERSRSPGSFRSRERSRSPESFRARERSRSPGYHRSGDRSHEREHKKDSYKSKELLSKGESRDSESRNRKKAQNYSSDDSICSISLESESASSDSSDDIQGKKEKSTTKPITKEKKTDTTKSLKTDTSKIENKALEDIFVKKADKSVLPDNISSQDLAELCNFQDKTSEDPGINEISKYFDTGSDLSKIVKMFENSHLVRKLVEGVHEQANSLNHPTPPPDASHNTPEHVNTVTHSIPSLEAAHNAPNLLTPSSFVPNVSYPSSEAYPIMPSVPIPFHPPPINSLPPLTFPPPPLVPPPVVPPPVMPLRVIPPLTVPPPTVPPSASTSVYGSFPASLSSVDVSRIPDTKLVKKRTLRPINITMDVTSPSKSSKEHSQPSLVTSAESKDKNIEKEKTASEMLSEQNNILIETYKKLKTEKHYAHVKVNSCVADMLEMRKIMDDTWGKKENPSDRVFYSRCKNMISASSSTMNECLKDAKRLDDELNRFKGLVPRHILEELVNIKIEEPPKYGNVQYSCYDTSNHTCYLCCKPFSNLLGVLEHLQSEEHKEQMAANDKDWTKKFKKPEKNKNEDKDVVLQPVKGVEFMKPLTGYFCSLCSETLLDKASAEQHLKSNEHYCQYKDFNLKNPIYEKKIFFKKFIQRSILSKAKEKIIRQEKEQQFKKAEEANEKVKDALRDQKNKEKVVEDLDDDDADPLSSKSHSSSGIKLNLSIDKDKQNLKEGSKAAKAPQRVVYIGKAPNYKARKPWYKKDIYQKNDESSSQSTESTLPVITFSKEKNSGNIRESSPSINSDSSRNDIPEAVATIKKGKITSKKVLESTCLTEEDSRKFGTSPDNASLSCKEKNSTVSNDPTICSTEGESKNLNNNAIDLKNVPLPSTEKAQPVSGDSSSIVNTNGSSKQSTSVQNTKDTHNQPGSPANESRDDTIAISKDSTVNQALKNILLGTDSSVQEIPLNEIKLPDSHDQNSSNTTTNSLLHGESNIPVPMEIEDTNDESVHKPQPKLTTEEDRDMYMLGINREDFLPLVVPVPPPSSLLGSGSPSDSPAASSPKHNCSSANEENNNADESNIMAISSVSTDIKKYKKSKYRNNSSNLIMLTECMSESLLKSDTEKTPIEFKDLITVCEAVESSNVNTSDVTAAVSTKSQDVNIESSVDTATSKEDNIMQINETGLETTKAIPLETDSITEKSSQVSDASESNENLNEVVSSDDKNFKKEPDTNLNLIKAVAQDGVTEISGHISDALKSNENLNEVTSSDNENLKIKPDINLNLTEDVAQSKTVNQFTPATDCVIAKSEQSYSDRISVSKCELSDSSNMADCVEINAKSLVLKDSDNRAFSSSIKPHDINQNSDLEIAKKSVDQNEISSENIITDVKICASTDETILVKNEVDGIKSMQDLVLTQSLNQDSNNEVPGNEVCESADMQDGESNIKPSQSLIIKQESPKETVSESCISPDILISDQQSNVDIKAQQNSEAEQLLNKVSVNENTPDMEVTVSENKADISQQCVKSDIEVVSEQSTYQDSHRESVSDMEVCVSVCETSAEMEQPSNSKPNLNLACSNNSVTPLESSEKNVHTEIIDAVFKEKVSEQPVVQTEMTFEKKENDELITTPSSTDLPTEIISDTKISPCIPESADINLTTSVNNSSDGILDSHSSIIHEQCLSKNVCSPEVVRMEIDSEQQAISTEKKSQSEVKSDQDLNIPHSLNQNLVAENTSDVTEEKLPQECHTSEKANETEFVEDKICDSMSTDSSHLISENLNENKPFEMDNKNLQPEPVLTSVKSASEGIPSEGVISQLSSNQCDNISEKTASYAIDTSLPDESVNEGLSPVPVSITEESVSEQETTQQKVDITLESIATVNKENEETVPDCNTSIISQMDEKQQAGSETNLKSPGIEENVSGDPESKTHILSSSSSGEVLETQNLTKSDTDTDEYENEE